MICGYSVTLHVQEWADVVWTACDMRNMGKWYWQHNQYHVLPCAS